MKEEDPREWIKLDLGDEMDKGTKQVYVLAIWLVFIAIVVISLTVNHSNNYHAQLELRTRVVQECSRTTDQDFSDCVSRVMKGL